MNEKENPKDIEMLTETELLPWMRLATDGIDIPVREIKEFVIPNDGFETDGRIYYPEGEGPFPVVFFIHGGAFVGGFNIMDEPVCRQICHDTGCAVISPNYRLAPEHKWPAAIDELYALLLYFKKNADEYELDMERLAIGGSSAGANYAAALCVKDYEKKNMDFKYQILIYPTTELSRTAGKRVTPFTVWDENPDQAVSALVDSYVPEGVDLRNPLISPLYGPIESFPKTCIFSGRTDLLWWEGKTFADKLIEAGVETLYKCYANTGHGFMELAGHEVVSRDVKNLICQELRRNL